MNDRYGWEDRDDRDRNRRDYGESSRQSRGSDDYRHSYGRGAGPREFRSEDDDWRSRGQQQSGNRYQGQSDFDRGQQRYSSSPGSTFGYGEGNVGSHGASAGGYGYSSQGRDDQSSRQSYAQQSDRGQNQGHRHYTSSAYGYSGGQQQGDTTPPQPYFTGQQQSWEVPTARGAPGSFGASYGGGTGGYRGGAGGFGGYGEDYREHGYGAGGQHRGFLEKAGDEIASWFGDEGAARRREEDHRGRGPSDYTRSDERIREDANDRLTEDARVDASAISVSVQDGEITLNGTVSSREQKRRAEDVVDNISGVKHVQNNLRVRSESSSASGYSSSGFGTGGTSVLGESTGSSGTASSSTSAAGTSSNSDSPSST